MTYIVTGPRAVVIIEGKRRVLDKGARVPASADEGRVKHLLSVGLIGKAPEELVEAKAPAKPAATK